MHRGRWRRLLQWALILIVTSGVPLLLEINLRTSAISSSERVGPTVFAPNDVALGTTRFSPHVEELLRNLQNVTDFSSCPNYYIITVNRTLSMPSDIIIQGYMRGGIPIENEWTKLLKRIFQNPDRTLPSSVSFGTTWGDYNAPGVKCIGSSSENGELTMMNFLYLKEQVRFNISIYAASIPWEQREQIPIFRGTGYGLHRDCQKKTFQDFLLESPRIAAVHFSLGHPTLLNARLSARTFNAPCWQTNTTEAARQLQSLRLVDDIAPSIYYSHYQVALVLGGIGAAFRLTHHLSTETAVILQDWIYQEWFTALLIPWVHYIPLQRNLSNLEEVLVWTRDHPNHVQQIAQAGQRFYQDFLSYSRNEEHVYEFVYRLALQQQGRRRTKP